MDIFSIVRHAADAAGVPVTHIGPAMGRGPGYFTTSAGRGSAPRVDTAARMLGACGWSLVAMPSADVPPGALVIDDTRPADARTPGAAPARQATPARAARHAAPRRAPSADVDALAGALAALPPSARAALARALAPADAPDADAADDAR